MNVSCWFAVIKQRCVVVFTLGVMLYVCFSQASFAAPETSDKQVVEKLDAIALLIKPSDVTGEFADVFAQIDRQISVDPIAYTDVQKALDHLNNQIIKQAGANPFLFHQVNLRKLYTEIVMVKQKTLNEKMTHSWQKSRVEFTANRLLKLNAQMWPEQLPAMLQSYYDLMDRFRNDDVREAIALAKSGWRLVDFHYPNEQQKKILEQNGLGKDKDHRAVADALKRYYQSIEDTRKAPAFERDLEALIDDPTNASLREKVAHGFYAHLKTLDLSDVNKVTSQMLIPDVIWVEVPETHSSVSLSDDRYDRLELAYYLFQNSLTMDFKEHLQWGDVIRTYDRCLEPYPYQATLVNRSYARLFAGQYKDAFEDMAISVAMSAYGWSRTFNKKMAAPNIWYFQGIPQVMVFADIAYDNEHSNMPFPSEPMFTMLDNMQRENWFGVARYVAEQVKGNAADSAIANQIRYNRGLKGKMLEALASSMSMTQDQASKLEHIQWAEVIGSRDFPVFEMIKIEKLPADQVFDTLKRKLNWKDYDACFDPAMNIAYAKELEKQGKNDEAMLHYNVACMGKPLSNTYRITKTAAENRDRLEGLTDKQAIAQKYINLINDIQKNAKVHETRYIANAQLVALVTRLTFLIKLNARAYGMRSDAYRYIEMFPQAIDDINTVIQMRDGQNISTLKSLKGASYYSMAQWSDAVSALTDAMNMGDCPNWVYSYRGDAYRQMGDYKQALLDYGKALALAPDNLPVLINRSGIYQYVLKDAQKAIADLEKYKSIQLAKDPKYKNFTVDSRLYNLKRARVYKN
jgi:tetratricopeptide (TPR) repeat protein